MVEKVSLVVKLQLVDDITSLLPLYLDSDTLALYMDEDDQRDIDKNRGPLEEGILQWCVHSLQEADHVQVGW